jgi:hypothetical protein
MLDSSRVCSCKDCRQRDLFVEEDERKLGSERELVMGVAGRGDVRWRYFAWNQRLESLGTCCCKTRKWSSVYFGSLIRKGPEVGGK